MPAFPECVLPGQPSVQADPYVLLTHFQIEDCQDFEDTSMATGCLDVFFEARGAI